MTEKGCGNCYYSFFDERAYPCSLCIRGIERTDKWQPSKKTKADRKTEPQNDWETEKRNNSLCYKCVKECDRRVLNRYTIECNQYEPKEQTEREGE